MGLADLFKLGDRGGRDEETRREAERLVLPSPPTSADLVAALDRTEAMVDGGAVPSVVSARVRRVVGTVRDTLPRLDALGAGSNLAYSVVATATDYLPDAVGGYLRLPRRFADSRPVDGGKTSLMVLVDQLDLLGMTMDQVFDAVYRDDANALVAHGRFLADKFGHRASGGDLAVDAGTPVPPPPVAPPAAAAAPAAPPAAAPSGAATSNPVAPRPATPPEHDSLDEAALDGLADDEEPRASSPESARVAPPAPSSNPLDLP